MRVPRSTVKSRSVMRSPAPEMERMSPTRASVTFRFARSSTGRTGAGRGFGDFLNRFIRTIARRIPRMASSVGVIMRHRDAPLYLGLFSGLLAGGEGGPARRQFLAVRGRRRRRRLDGLLP